MGKNNIDDFVKKIDFDEKLRKINNKVTLNKTKHVEAEKKLNNSITFHTNLKNEPSREVRLISS